jgi:hypothetical protein
MGITTEIGVEIYETANFPTPIVKEFFGGKNIVDFSVGEDVTAILLDSNEVYWSGSKIAYKPEKYIYTIYTYIYIYIDSPFQQASARSHTSERPTDA